MLFFIDIALGQNHELHDDLINISGIITSRELANISVDSYQWIDELYTITLEYKQNDVSETLFLLTFATLQFRAMPLNLPFSSQIIYMPLPRPPDSLFYAKNRMIPKQFPFVWLNGNNNRDKYSHFFGNAFLAFNIRIFNLSKFMGIFVEYFEDAFKVEGAVDLNDVSVNHLGEVFGEMLTQNHNLKPSEAIRKIEFLLSIKL